MRDKVGEIFSGKVSRITNFGIFVTLDNVHIDGMVHVSDLGEDYFQYREDLMAMVGERSGVRFSVGDRVQVKVARADLDTCRIDLVLASEPPKAKKRGKKVQAALVQEVERMAQKVVAKEARTQKKAKARAAKPAAKTARPPAKTTKAAKTAKPKPQKRKQSAAQETKAKAKRRAKVKWDSAE